MRPAAKSVLTEAQALVAQAEEHRGWRSFLETRSSAAIGLEACSSHLRILEIGVDLGCEDEAVTLQRAVETRYHLARLLDILERSDGDSTPEK